MYDLLRGFPNLKVFEWEEMALIKYAETLSNISGRSRMRGLADGYWICVALQMHCKDLESLTIRSPFNHVTVLLGDISNFSELRYLKVYSWGLFTNWRDYAVLPKSLETLVIDCGIDEVYMTCKYCTESLFIKEQESTKKTLKQITIECRELWKLTRDTPWSPFDAVQSSQAELRECCKAHGVALNIIDVNR